MQGLWKNPNEESDNDEGYLDPFARCGTEKVRVCYPVHYGAIGMYWHTREIEPKEVDYYRAMHPNMQIVGRC